MVKVLKNINDNRVMIIFMAIMLLITLLTGINERKLEQGYIASSSTNITSK